MLSLGLILGRPIPKPAPAPTHVSGEFPVFRPDDSGQFAKISAMRHKPKRKAHKPKSDQRSDPKMVKPRPSRLSLLITVARQYVGVRYVWGGTTPSGFDCSGYTRYVYRKLGVYLPRVSSDQAHVGRAVPSMDRARIGDLLFFGSPIHHVAIYVGRRMMLDAPHTGSFVQLRRVYQTPSSIRRVL